MLITVVANSVDVPELTKLAPQVIVLAVPLSLMRINKRCPSTGVPDKPDVIDVMFVANAVMSY